jgi:hypothetical protein
MSDSGQLRPLANVPAVPVGRHGEAALEADVARRSRRER